MIPLKIVCIITAIICGKRSLASELRSAFSFDEPGDSFPGRVLASAMDYCQPNINCLPPRKCLSIDNGPSTCQCPPPLIQDPATNACGVPSSTVRVVVYLTTIRFNSQFLNSGSPKFQALQAQFLSTIWLIILANTDAAGFVLNVYVIRFLPGSVIVHADVVLKRGSNATAKDVRRIFRQGFRNPPSHAPLNLTSAKLRNVYAEDPCGAEGIALCPDPNTECVSDGLEFSECRCVDGFTETVDPSTGMIACALTCPRGYCGNNGRCEFVKTTKKCYCPDGYMGERCQFSIMDIGISLLMTFILFGVAGSLIMVTIHRKRRQYAKKQDDASSIGSVESRRTQKSS